MKEEIKKFQKEILSLSSDSTTKIKNSQLNTILSWLNHMCFEEIDKKFKECNEVEKLIYEVEKYYRKMKPTQICNSDLERVTEKLKEVQKTFEDEITLLDENGNHIMQGDDIQCIDYSPQLLMITSLDYLINVERDLSLRIKFSHINFNELFEDVEKKDSKLFYSTMKIYNKMIGVLNA